MQKNLFNFLNNIGQMLFVGGCVRDEILNRENKDIDIEVYGIEPNDLLNQLKKHKNQLNINFIDTVGMSFGIIKVKLKDGSEYDISFPRRDNRIGNGHRGFICIPDPNMSVKEAASRRDFTFNSLARNLEGEVIDFFGGISDLKKRIIRATSPAFQEDPLRVLRGMQFAGRFGFNVDEGTAMVCAVLAGHFEYISKERVWGEWEKFLMKANVPSYGLKYLEDTGWVECFPQLSKLIGLQQHAEYHPEGDVWNHTMQSLDAACAICDRENIDGEQKLVIMLAVLCHDFGKVTTTEFNSEKGKLTSYGHDSAGEIPTREFLELIGCPKKYHEKIILLVTNHMAHLNIKNAKHVRKLANKLKNVSIYDLCIVMEADHSGRGGLDIGRHKNIDKILQLAEELNLKDQAPKPIIMGRHLIDKYSGPELGKILKKAFVAQLEGEFDNLKNGLIWVEQLEKGD